MDNRFTPTLFGFAALSTLLLSIQPASAADWSYSYCSSLNTGEQNTAYTWPFQSNGNCTNHCKEEGGPWAFAVIKYTDCWCSNYVPGDTASSSDCLQDCPGFPDEKCGSKDKDLYIYVQMDGQPSGTKGGSQPSSTAAAPSKQSQQPQSQQTQTQQQQQQPQSQQQPQTQPQTQPPTYAPPPAQVVTSIVTQKPETVFSTVTAAPDSSSSSSSTNTKKPSSTQAPSQTQEPVTVPTVVTESGNVITRTVVITPSASASATNDSKDSPNIGAIAGGVAGGIIGLLAIIAIVLFVLWKRRRQQREEQEGGGGIQRNVSTMSRAGLLGGRAEKSSTPLTTTFGSQRSPSNEEMVTPIASSTRRLSQPILVDSRLNPAAVLTFHGANLSRESLCSIDDSRDYGRQLNVRNPDP